MSSGHWAVDLVPHKCEVPEDAEIRAASKKVGDVWQCDECMQRWAVRYMDGGMREPDVHHYYMTKVWQG